MSAVMSARAVALPVSRPRIAPVTRWSLGALGLVLLIVAGVAIKRFAHDPLRFPVSNIDVLGTLDYTDRTALGEVLNTHLDQGFYGLDIDDVRQSLEALPWIESARISRIWPARLSIDISEHEPAALWNEQRILSKTGALLDAPQLAGDDANRRDWSQAFEALPRLSGSEGRDTDVMSDFRLYERELAALGVEVVAVDEDDRRSRTLTLSNAVSVRLGYDDRERRLARFIDVYARLVPPLGGTEASFDMRYTNGFALSSAADELSVEGEAE